jgi:hypothetical protein
MDGACSTYGERRGVYRVWVGKPDGKRTLVRHRRRWEDNIKMDLQDVGGVGMLDQPAKNLQCIKVLFQYFLL